MLDASLDHLGRGVPDSSLGDRARMFASVWRSACRACEGARHAAAGCEDAGGCEGNTSDQMRGLPLERDAVASVCADRSGVLANRAGYCRGTQEDGPFAVGKAAGG